MAPSLDPLTGKCDCDTPTIPSPPPSIFSKLTMWWKNTSLNSNILMFIAACIVLGFAIEIGGVSTIVPASFLMAGVSIRIVYLNIDWKNL
jgi:hypothetical protein